MVYVVPSAPTAPKDQQSNDPSGGDNSRFDPNLEVSSLKRRSLQGAVVTYLSQGSKFVLMFGSQIVMARLLDPVQFGIVAMVYPVLGLVQVFNDLGLTQAIVQRSEVNARQLTSLFWIGLAVSAGLAVILGAMSPLLGWLYHEPRVVAVNAVLAGLIVVSGLALQQSALLNRQMRFSTLAAIEVGSTFAGVAVGILSAWYGAGYWALVMSQAASSICSTTLVWLCSQWRPSWPSRLVDVWPMLRFGGHITGSNLIGYLNSAADNVMVGYVQGALALGMYDRSYKLVVTPLQQLVSPIGRVALPLLARLTGSDERYRQAYLQMLQTTLLATTPSLVFAIVASPVLIPTLLGEKWAAAAPIFAWMCVSAISMPVCFSTFWILISQKRSAEQLRYSTIVAVLNMCAYAIGLRWGGVVGVAQAAAFYCWFFQLPFLVWASTRSGCVRLRTVLPTLLTFLIAMLVTAAVLGFAADALLRFGFGGIGMFFALSYATFVMVLFCIPTGNRFLRDARASLATLRVKPNQI